MSNPSAVAATAIACRKTGIGTPTWAQRPARSAEADTGGRPVTQQAT